MSAWLTYELHTAGGLTITSEVSEEEARTLLGTEHRYIFPREDLSEREKVVQMTMTQLAIALEKQSGIFVVTDASGRTWMIPNAHIIAATYAEPSGSGGGIGFRQFSPAEAMQDGPQ